MTPMASNRERMIGLADEFFAAKNDPSQISVTEDVMQRLREVHLMNRFIAKLITEKELLEKTPVPGKYDAVYLCSALVLPEQRGKGLARQLTSDAIRAIALDQPVEQLFFWAFSNEGEALAAAVAHECELPLYKRLE